MTAPPAAAPPEYRGRRAARPLRDCVGGYTGYRLDAAPPSVHRGVPSAHLTLLLCVDGAVEVLENADPAAAPGRFTAAVAGLHDRPAAIAQGEPQTGLQVELTWRGARELLGLPAGELAGGTVDLAAVLGRDAERLLDRLHAAGGWEERFAVLDAELARLAERRGAGSRAARPEIGYAWDRLVETGGALHVGDLARELGWSRRHLADRFRAETGLPPKAAARVIRFARACARLRAPDRPPLARVAAEGGYADQAHLAREFRELAGQTATEWLAERGLR